MMIIKSNNSRNLRRQNHRFDSVYMMKSDDHLTKSSNNSNTNKLSEAKIEEGDKKDDD